MKEDSVGYVLGLLREAMGEDFVYFDGDPDLIAKHELPAIIVEMVQDVTVGGTFAEDDVTDTVLIKVVLDKSKDWSAKRENLNLTHKKVRDHIGARDKDDGTFLDNTVKGALRREIYSDDGRISNGMTVDYGFLTRPEDVFTSEGHVTVNVTYPVMVDPSGN